VWVIFRKGAELLYKLLCDNGYAVGLVYGGSDVEVVKRRVESGDIRVLVASVKKLGVSVDFLRAFRRAVYVDIPVSFTEYMQSQDRIARRGMGGSVFLHRLVVKDSLDSYICEILRRKEDMVRQVGAEVDEELEVDVDEFLKCI
jgi:SNF2 family DNA or RNA helicase